MKVSCAYDLFIKLWNVENDYQNFATLRGHEHSVSSAKFLPGDDRIISSSRDQTVRIWEIATTYVRTSVCWISDLRCCSFSHCVKVIRPHSDWIRSAIPSSDGKFFITCSMDHVCLFFFPLIFENIGLNHERPRILLNLIQEIRNRSYVAMTTL
jgi:platelet-activating factor acetylhydrolase IB subunit alpha